MITFLVAHVPTTPATTAAELVLGPAAGLLRRQFDAGAAVGRAVGTVAGEAAARLGPGVAVAVAGLMAVVAASFLLAGVATLAGSLRARPAAA